MKPQWLNYSDSERVAHTRWLCYGDAGKELVRFRELLAADRRAANGDFLIIEDNGHAVATATSLSLNMWVRGGKISCQGVAWVGGVKSARRRGAARAAMVETLRLGRERGNVVSALMPFRVSFYESFGYGLVERRAVWTIPLPLIPVGNVADWHPIAPADTPRLAQVRQQMVESGQCNIERAPAGWDTLRAADEDTLSFCSNRAWVTFMHSRRDDLDELRAIDWGATDFAAVADLLRFLGTLRDQYSSITIGFPENWPVNWLLKEAQLPHRPVNHPTAKLETITRMQLRILDHPKFLSALLVPKHLRGSATVEVRECEGHSSKFILEVSDGKIATKTSSESADFHCPDKVWAAIATGELSATIAVRMGLANEEKAGAAGLLDDLFKGVPPFCHEYF